MARVLLVLSDLDDTFLTRDKRLPPENAEALDLLAEHGAAFVPCTGRPVGGIPAYLMAHEATRFAVASNGGVIVDAKTLAVLHRSVLDTQLVSDVYRQVSHLNITFDAFVPGHVFAERMRYDAMVHFGIDKANLDTIRSLREPDDQPIPERIAGYEGVEKVTVYWGDEQSRDEAWKVLSSTVGIEVTTSHPRNFEFMARGTSKGSALRWLCGHLGCDASETVAFGDSLNDVPMIEAAGDGVAVENASDEVKAAADHVCGSCDEAGVGRYLMMLLK